MDCVVAACVFFRTIGVLHFLRCLRLWVCMQGRLLDVFVTVFCTCVTCVSMFVLCGSCA